MPAGVDANPWVPAPVSFAGDLYAPPLDTPAQVDTPPQSGTPHPDQGGVDPSYSHPGQARATGEPEPAWPAETGAAFGQPAADPWAEPGHGSLTEAMPAPGDALGAGAAAPAPAWADTNHPWYHPAEPAGAAGPDVEDGHRPPAPGAAERHDRVDGFGDVGAGNRVDPPTAGDAWDDGDAWDAADTDDWDDEEAWDDAEAPGGHGDLTGLAPGEPSDSSSSTALVPARRRRLPSVEPGQTAVSERDPARMRRPGRESWADPDDLEPWDEIPLRVTLSDRAAAILPGSWRIAVTSLFPYSGTTTLAGVVGLTLAGVRAEPVLAVDLHPGTDTPGFVPPTSADSVEIDESRGDNLVSRVGSRGVTTVADIARQRRSSTEVSPEDVRALIGARRSGSVFDLDVLPVDRPATSDEGTAALVPVTEPVTATMLRTVLGGLAHAYPLILMDAPAAAPLTPTAIRCADAVVLVTLATASDLETTLADLRNPQGALAGVGVVGRERPGHGQEALHPDHGGRGGRTGPAVIAAVVSPRRGRPSPRTRNATARLARYVDGIVRIPYDPRLDPSRGTPVRIPRLRWATRRSYLRVAAETVEALTTLADAEVEASTAGGHALPGPPLELAAPNVSTLPHTADADHTDDPGVSFGDLRPGGTPARVSEPDRPGGPPPAGREPR